MKRMMITAALILGLATSAPAQVKLKWKVGENEKLTSTTKTLVHQMLSIAGMDIETKNEQTVVAETVTGKRAEDGTIRKKSTIKSLKADLTMPGGVTLNFDSSKAISPQGTQFDVLLDLMQAVSKTSSTTVLGKDNRVVSVKADTSAHEKLDDQIKAMLKGRFDSDYLTELSNKELDQVPSKPLKKGASWKLSQTLRLEAGQSLTFKTTYKYDGTIKRKDQTLDKITFTSTDVSYKQEGDGAGAKVTDSKMKIQSSKGEILFDRGLGRIVANSEKVHIKGELTLEVNNQTLPAKLDLKIENKTSVR